MKKIIISLAVVALALASCEKEEKSFNEIQKEINPETLYSKTEFNLDMRDFAMAVDIAINSNSSFRKLVHSESIKKFDGAYDVVLSEIVNKQLSQDNLQNSLLKKVKTANSVFQVSDLLEDALITITEISLGTESNENSPKKRINRLKKVSPANSILNILIEKYPELQISVPVHPEDLDDPNYIPPVAFITEEYQNGNSNYIVGYNNTNTIVIDGIKEPEKAVIVVGLNERLQLIDDEEVDPVVPAPINLNATTSAEGIQLVWQKASTATLFNTTGYIIERKKSDDDDFVIIQENYGINNLVHSDITTESGRTYNYRIRAFLNISDLNTTRVYSDISNIVDKVAPARTNPPLTFSVTQATSGYAELNWTTDPGQYILSTNVYKNIVGDPVYNLFGSYSSNQYHSFDTQIKGGQVVRYAIQNETSTGKSNFLYDYIHVSYRDPSKTSPVRIKSLVCDGREFEPWGMGPPEFRIKIVGGNKKDKTTNEIAKCIYLDFGGTDIFGWDKTQYFHKLAYDWPYNLYETNYDVITLYLIESDHNNFEQLEFTGKIGGKSAIKVGTETLPNSPNSISAGIDTESAISAKYDFLKDEDLGWRDYYYYEPIDKTLEFYYKSSTVYITLGQ
jgi:PBP1b-binding outer membrane lipoprotein LpoB